MRGPLNEPTNSIGFIIHPSKGHGIFWRAVSSQGACIGLSTVRVGLGGISYKLHGTPNDHIYKSGQQVMDLGSGRNK